jgi:hypothetical protein
MNKIFKNRIITIIGIIFLLAIISGLSYLNIKSDQCYTDKRINEKLKGIRFDVKHNEDGTIQIKFHK